jgi:hypothetical protein
MLRMRFTSGSPPVTLIGQATLLVAVLVIPASVSSLPTLSIGEQQRPFNHDWVSPRVTDDDRRMNDWVIRGRGDGAPARDRRNPGIS